MAGRIREQSIAEVREKARIDEVVSSYVTLRNAGGGSMKGLCPFHDEKTPSFNVNPSRGFYHCLAGETRVLTDQGAQEIGSLAGGTHRILNRHGDWVEAPFSSYGVQPLLRITLTRNRQRKELFATEGHRWFVRSGVGGRHDRERVTTELRPGDRLVPTYPRSRIRRTTPSPVGIAHGYTFGAGTRSGDGSMRLCPPKDLATLAWFPRSHPTETEGDVLVHRSSAYVESPPPLQESVSYLYGWLAGYLAADGCVSADGTVSVNSADRSHLEFVRTVCTRLGIATFGITTQLCEGSPGPAPSELHRVHLAHEDLTEPFFLIAAHREHFLAARTSLSRRGWVVQGVERTSRVEEVFCAEVTGGHAFTLEDNILTGNCFGCQQGGDVINFLMQIDGLSFAEAVERLADTFGVQLQRDDSEHGEEKPRGPQRGKLIEAHKVAQQFYAEQLGTPDAQVARTFLLERGFDQSAAETFGLGFAPRDGEALYRHLRARGFSDEEVVAGGLVAVGRSPYDRFRGRLLWPIREANGDTIGFGARRIFDDDRIDAKYLNTSETPLYKKSQVLYGIDLARREMSRSSQAVVVEGYTDVMACHLAGVGTAVATCGTAFGDDHGRVLRRFMADHDEFRGEVIFAFDGDAPGQAAALKTFKGDANFVSQTYVTVEPQGLDPCDLRIKEGDAAVRELVARRVPLYRFVLANVVSRYDLDRADGRVGAVREAAALVTSSRDASVVESSYARELAALTGMDPVDVQTEVRKASRRTSGRGQAATTTRPGAGPSTGAASQAEPAPLRRQLPDLRDPRFEIERETLKLVLQHPMVIGRTTSEVGPEDFTHPTFRGVWELVAAAGGPGAGMADAGWSSRLRGAATETHVASAIASLSVDPLLSARDPDGPYVAHHVVRLLELTTLRRIAQVKARLQRTNPVDDPESYNKMFGELAALEQHRRGLRDRIVGQS